MPAMENMTIADLKAKYPHVAGYITEEGILRAEKQTLETWEFEAELCDRVIAAFKGDTDAHVAICPQCKGRTFKIGETIVDFNFPFVHSYRIQVYGFHQSRWIRCIQCGAKEKNRAPKEARMVPTLPTVGNKTFCLFWTCARAMGKECKHSGYIVAKEEMTLEEAHKKYPDFCFCGDWILGLSASEKKEFEQHEKWLKTSSECENLLEGPAGIPTPLPNCTVTRNACRYEHCPKVLKYDLGGKNVGEK